MQKRDEYTNNDYHAVSDEVKPDWDFSGAVQDMAMLFRVGYGVAQGRQSPMEAGDRVQGEARLDDGGARRCREVRRVEEAVTDARSGGGRRLGASRSAHSRRAAQHRQRRFDLRAVRLEPGREHERLAQMVERLVGGEARPFGRELEQHAARLEEVDRLEPEPVDHLGRPAVAPSRYVRGP